jgi:hypothetical protein
VGASKRTRSRLAPCLAIGILIASGCNGSDTTPQADEVVPADAYIAVVGWESKQNDAVLDQNGDPELPVVYVAPADGGTIDVGIQAAVVEATVDIAIVRFADDVSEALDTNETGEPVKDDGILLIVGDMPEPSNTIQLGVIRYRSMDDDAMLTIEITASAEGATVRSALPN